MVNLMDRLNSWLNRVRVVLVEPTHPGNVGACARAMLAMGLNRLYIADIDRGLTADPQAIAMASGADRVLEQTTFCSLEAALDATTLSLALTARPREFEPPRRTLSEATTEFAQWLAQEPLAEVALVFGPERSGLSNEHLLLCNRVCGLDVNPAFSSLNLSQAVQLVSYSMRMGLRALDLAEAVIPTTGGAGRPTATPAKAAAVDGLHHHLLRVAEACEALDPENPGRMHDRLRRLWARSGLLEDEVQMLRGILTEMERQLHRRG
ncbi:MAG: RNA methyltransferase [Burkholderiaceae bacterium]